MAQTLMFRFETTIAIRFHPRLGLLARSGQAIFWLLGMATSAGQSADLKARIFIFLLFENAVIHFYG
jgi:hypothetical protein